VSQEPLQLCCGLSSGWVISRIERLELRCFGGGVPALIQVGQTKIEHPDLTGAFTRCYLQERWVCTPCTVLQKPGICQEWVHVPEGLTQPNSPPPKPKTTCHAKTWFLAYHCRVFILRNHLSESHQDKSGKENLGWRA
jgi:hypothetical protein